MSILASHPPTAKPPMTERAEFWRHAKSSSVLFRALKVSLTVGSLLMLINYGDKLLAGTLTLRDRAQPVLGAYVDGDHLGFTFVDLDGGVRSVRARIDGGTLSGSLRFAGLLTPVTGRRR